MWLIMINRLTALIYIYIYIYIFLTYSLIKEILIKSRIYFFCQANWMLGKKRKIFLGNIILYIWMIRMVAYEKQH